MDNKYISELLEKRKRLRNFIKFPYQYEELNENLEDKVKKAKTDLNFIQKEIDKFFKKKGLNLKIICIFVLVLVGWKRINTIKEI